MRGSIDVEPDANTDGSVPPTARKAPVEIAIALRGVEKRYGDHVALEATTLDIQDGEFLCLLGPSGCGKTTTLNIIGGFVAPTRGEVYLKGCRVDHLPPHRRDVNTVFQSYALFPHMTVRDNVGFGLRMARVPRAQASVRIAEALALVGLEDFGHRPPGELSGGQQQRVAVARALVNRPVVLLLDEPLGALDLKLRKRLQLELAQLRRELGMTFVYVTHDQEEAMAMGDRIAVMNAGRVEQVGTPTEIYHRPVSRFVADFIGESNFLDAALVPAHLAGGARQGTLMVRPEALQIERETPGGGGLPGEIVQTAFLGSHTRVAVACAASSAPVTVSCFGAGAMAIAEPGTRVALSWDPKAAVRLPE